MAEQSDGTFLTELYSRLENEGVSLDNKQKSILERVLVETLGVSTQSTDNVESIVEDPLTTQLMDRELLNKVCEDGGHNLLLATRIQRGIYRYSDLDRANYDDYKEHVTDAHALELHQEGIRKIENARHITDLEGFSILRNFGRQSFDVLHAYLVEKDLAVNELPQPGYLSQPGGNG